MLNQDEVRLIQQTRTDIEKFIHLGILSKLKENQDTLQIFKILEYKYPIEQLACLVFSIYKKIMWVKEELDPNFLANMYKLQEELSNSNQPESIKAYNDLMRKWWNWDIDRIIEGIKSEWFKENPDPYGHTQTKADRFIYSIYIIVDETWVLKPEKLKQLFKYFQTQGLSKECSFIKTILVNISLDIETANEVLQDYVTICKDEACKDLINIPGQSSSEKTKDGFMIEEDNKDWIIPTIIIGTITLIGLFSIIYYMKRKKK